MEAARKMPRPVIWLLIAISLVAGCTPSTSGHNPRVIEEHWPDGSLHVRRSVVSNWRGAEVNHGPLEVWYENGQQRSLGHWKNGRKHGQFFYWYENGQKKMELTNVDGRAHGRVQEWDPAGHRIRDEVWRDGRPLQE